MTGQDKVTF